MTERLHFHFSVSCIGEGNGNPLQCSCLENPRDGGVWWAAVHGITQSQTRLTRLSSSSSKDKVTKSLLTLRTHELQHSRLLCLPVSPSVCSDSCPLSEWGLTGLILQFKGLSKVFSSTIRKYQFFGAQPSLWSNCHIHTWLLEKSVFTVQKFVSKVMSMLSNTLSRFVLAFLPRSKCLSILWL